MLRIVAVLFNTALLVLAVLLLMTGRLGREAEFLLLLLLFVGPLASLAAFLKKSKRQQGT
jgi:hypothetical protein